MSTPEQTPLPAAQEQPYPGDTDKMDPHPRDDVADYVGRGLLEGRRALVTGGDSGIGRAVAVAFAKEGADVAVAYLCEDDDARRTAELVEAAGRQCVLMPGDLADADHCQEVVSSAVRELGGLDLLVNNAAYQESADSLREISDAQWLRTFNVNIHSYFRVTRAALAHLPQHSAIINTASVNGLKGNNHLIDYSTTKGAIIAFTYSLAQSLVPNKIRVNCVAPGPVWTPLIPATFPANAVKDFGKHVPMQRPAQPDEIAPSYVFFASDRLSSYYSGEVLSPIGGLTLPG
jgi:NAD(P)-dependent dehydrogenase (short-subunit alcohol dehydrogenase family)